MIKSYSKKILLLCFTVVCISTTFASETFRHRTEEERKENIKKFQEENPNIFQYDFAPKKEAPLSIEEAEIVYDRKHNVLEKFKEKEIKENSDENYHYIDEVDGIEYSDIKEVERDLASLSEQSPFNLLHYAITVLNNQDIEEDIRFDVGLNMLERAHNKLFNLAWNLMDVLEEQEYISKHKKNTDFYNSNLLFKEFFQKNTGKKDEELKEKAGKYFWLLLETGHPYAIEGVLKTWDKKYFKEALELSIEYKKLYKNEYGQKRDEKRLETVLFDELFKEARDLNSFSHFLKVYEQFPKKALNYICEIAKDSNHKESKEAKKFLGELKIDESLPSEVKELIEKFSNLSL